MIPIMCGAATLMGFNAYAFQDDDQGCYVAAVLDAEQGDQSNGQPVADNRSDTDVVLMAPDASNAPGGFYSLGIGGTITLQLAGAVTDLPGDDLMIYETSFSGDDCGASDDEFALVEVSQSGDSWVILAEEICRDASLDLDGTGLPFITQIRITDLTSNGDGWDLDGIMAINGCTPVDELDGCYGEEIISFTQGPDVNGGAVADNRSDETAALMEPDRSNAAGGFVSLGFGGSITIKMSGAVINGDGPDIKIWETTFNGDDCGSNAETASVELSDGISWVSAGDICKDGTIELDGIALPYVMYVRITDLGNSPNDGYDVDGVEALNGCGDIPFSDPEVCNNFDTFLVDNPIGNEEGNSGLYRVNFSGSNAELVLLSELEYRAHLAFDTDLNLIYAVHNDGTGFDTIDPFTGMSSGFTAFDENLGGTPTAVYNDGILYVGSSAQNKIVGYNLTTDMVFLVAEDIPVSGGDLLFNGGELYLATRSGNNLWRISGGVPMDPISIPQKVLGLALTDGGSILMANTDENAFNLLNADGTDSGDDISITLDGNPFTLRNGDLASGCNIPNNEESGECLNFDVFYADIPAGAGPSSLYKVNFAGGAADLALIREFDGNTNYHIAYNYDDNVIYAVNENGSGFETIDPLTGTSTFTSFPINTEKTTTAVYYEGILYVGSDQRDEIFSYELADGTLASIGSAPVKGGDLVIIDEQIFLASQNDGGNWYSFVGGTATQLQATPGNGLVNGAALLDDGSIMFSNKDENVFRVLNGGSVTDVPVFLNGEPFTLRWGDLATGCNLQNNEEQCSPELVNGGFEELAVGYSISGGWDYVPQEEIPGWSTTMGSGTIEIQESGAVNGNESNSGDLHFELNGDGLNNIYQEICSEPGTKIKISFAHKKRQSGGDDILNLYVSGMLDGIESTDAAPYMVLFDEGWVNQEFVYEVPAGQTSTFIYFKAMSGTSNTVGNLMDDVSVELTTDATTDFNDLNATLSTQQRTFNSITQIDMYPVPATDRLNVSVSTPTPTTLNYEVVSIMGQSFNRNTINTNSGQTKITADISNLAEGTYFFVMNMNGNTITKQFVKAGR